VPKGRVESRLVVPAIMANPAADVRIEHACQIIERFVAALVKRPTANRLSDLFESFVARRWTEHDAKPLPSARQPRPECIAEKIDSTSVIILAVDNLCLLVPHGPDEIAVLLAIPPFRPSAGLPAYYALC
jgi:hypothetical protein